jgi:hypothetical protein
MSTVVRFDAAKNAGAASSRGAAAGTTARLAAAAAAGRRLAPATMLAGAAAALIETQAGAIVLQMRSTVAAVAEIGVGVTLQAY